MKRLLLIFFLFSEATLCTAQQSRSIFLTADSLKEARNLGKWLCMPGDNLQWAARALNDSSWTPCFSNRINLATDTPIRFEGIAWFRKHFSIDSSLVGRPIALSVRHGGASQIFLDGDSLTNYGVLTPRDSADYYNPQDEPFMFVLHEPGEHVLAVRYAEWGAKQASDRWGEDMAGFTMALANAEYAVASQRFGMLLDFMALLTLVVLFGTLGFIHLILWLYYRAARSNLPFAIFSLCLSALFYCGLLVETANNPAKVAWGSRLSIYVILAGSVALSAFINTLFSRRKWRFRIVAGLGILSAILILVPYELYVAGVLPLVLFVFVLLETVILTVVAIFKRVPGARIIGAGVLLFSLLTLSIFAVGVFNQGIRVNINPTDSPFLFALTVASVLAVPISMSVYLAWNFAAVNKRLKGELIQVATLSEKNRLQEEERQRLLESRKDELEREVTLRTSQLRSEKQKSDDLLLNILPEEVAEELKERGHAQARLHNNVSVLFTDFVDFTSYSERLSPEQIVEELDGCFKAFDSIIERHGLEKIKTIGDAYMAVAGLPVPHPDGAASTVRAALDIRDYIARRRAENPASFDIRMGVHSGAVVAGIIGVKKFAYDVWGDTVNTAARMEQRGEPGRVNISTATYELVKDHFVCSYRGEVEAKGKGAMGMWFVEAVA